MTSRIWWFVASLVVSLIATAAIATTVYPRWMKTPTDALAWGLIGSALFLLATLITGLAVAQNREARLPTPVMVVAGLLLAAGVIWALLWTIAVGL
jgi:hypothetical protein